MLRTAEIMLGEFLPSFPKPRTPGCRKANNCIPAEGGGYKPMKAPEQRFGSFPAPVLGAQSFFRSNGNMVVVGGTRNTLFHITGGTATSTAGMVALSPGEYWDFAQFNDFVFATSITNDMQYLPDIDTDATWSTSGGSPPKAKYCERFGDFLMLGNIDGAPNRVQWSAFNAPTASWAASRLTQAGSLDLDPRFGAVTALVGGRYPMVFQERGVSLMQYAGPPTVWRVSLVSEERGCVAPFSAVTVGSLTYFLAHDGFWVTNGSEFTPVGSQKVNRWFLDTVDNRRIPETHGAIDWPNKCVVWAIPSGDTAFDKSLFYSWEQDRFSTSCVRTDRLVSTQLAGMSLEDVGALFASLEIVTPDFDDAYWKPGSRALGAFLTDDGLYYAEEGCARDEYLDDGYHVAEAAVSTYHTFTGDNLEAEWEIGSFQPAPGKRAFVSKAEAIAEADDWTMEIAAVPATNARVETYGDYRAPGVDGAVPIRADGKEMRMAIRFPAAATWQSMAGVQVTYRESGVR